MPADNAVYPPVQLPGRDVRVADDVIDECLQTTLSILQYAYLVETSGWLMMLLMNACRQRCLSSSTLTW